MFNSTVDQILSSLASGVQKLSDLADRKDGEAGGHRTKATEFTAKADEATREAERARRVAEKVKAFLG